MVRMKSRKEREVVNENYWCYPVLTKALPGRPDYSSYSEVYLMVSTGLSFAAIVLRTVRDLRLSRQTSESHL